MEFLSPRGSLDFNHPHSISQFHAPLVWGGGGGGGVVKKHHSCTVHITRSRAPIPSQYLLYGQVLESIASSKYQSVKISSILSFNNHIQSITTSASQSLGFLRRNIRTQNPALREMAYKIPVCPLMEYSSTIYLEK